MAHYYLTFAVGTYPKLPEEKAYVEAVYSKFLKGAFLPGAVQWNDAKRTLVAEIDEATLTHLQRSIINAVNTQKENYPCFQNLTKIG